MQRRNWLNALMSVLATTTMVSPFTTAQAQEN